MILEKTKKNSSIIPSDETYPYKIRDFKDLKIYNNLYDKNNPETENKEGIWIGNIEKRKGSDFKIVDRSPKLPIIYISNPDKRPKDNSEFIVPTLLETWKESAVVFETLNKVELLTSGARKEKFGNKILKFSPHDKISAGYNFLSEVRILSLYEKEDVRNIANSFAQGFINMNENEYFEKQISDFLFSIIFYKLYVSFLSDPHIVEEQFTSCDSYSGEVFKNACKHEVKIKGNKKTIFRKSPYAALTMKKIYNFLKEMLLLENPEKFFLDALSEDIIEKYGKNEETKNLVKKWYKDGSKAKNHYFKPKNKGRFWKEWPFKEYFEKYSVMETEDLKFWIRKTLKFLSIFENKNYCKNTSKSDFRIVQINNHDKPVTLYFQIASYDIIMASPILKIFVNQFVSKMEENHSDTIIFSELNKHKCLLVFNEFLAFGKFRNLAELNSKFRQLKIKTFYNCCTDPKEKVYKNGFFQGMKLEIKDYIPNQFLELFKKKGIDTINKSEKFLYLKPHEYELFQIKEVDIKNSSELRKLSEIMPATSEKLLDNKTYTELSPNVAKLLKEKIEKELKREKDLIERKERKMLWKDFVEKYL
jgi:hypothetical protein